MPRFRSSRQLLLPVIVPLLAPVALFGPGWQHTGSVQKVQKLSDGVELTAGKAKVRLTVFRDGIFRVRVAQTGTFSKDFSWAVIETPEAPAVRVDDTKEEVRVTSGNIVARIRKSPLLIDFLRDIGDVLVADDNDLPMAWDNGRVHVWKKMPEVDGYYRLRNNTGPINRRDRAFTHRNTAP